MSATHGIIALSESVNLFFNETWYFQTSKTYLLNAVLYCIVAEKLEPLYAPIRHKLANALTNWHPSDASAKVILQPWVGVWKEGHMEVFLRKNILPKLAMCMQEFPISPHQQVLGRSLLLSGLCCQKTCL